MLLLMRRMVERLAGDRDGLRFDFFNLSSIVSTKALPLEEKSQQIRRAADFAGLIKRGAAQNRVNKLSLFV